MSNMPEYSPEYPARRNRILGIMSSRMEVTDAGLTQIKQFKYHSGFTTPLENGCSTCMWNPMVNRLPMWLAPNTITFVGLVLVILGYLVLISFYVRDFSEAAPRWVYLFVAFTQIAYICLDNMDGKQARRTGSSSPLGHLFDHGCDSVSTSFIAQTLVASCRCGFSGRGLIVMYLIELPFWLAQWEEYHTHSLEVTLGGIVGITEGGFIGAGLIAMSGIFGPDLWLIDLDWGTLPAWYCGDGKTCGVTPREIVIVLQGVACLMFCYKSFAGVFQMGEDKCKALVQVLPIALFTWLGFAWCTIPHTHPRLVLFALGMVFTYLTNKMIVNAMARMEYSFFTGGDLLIPLPFLYAVSRFKLWPGEDDVLLGAYCCYAVFKVSYYIYRIVEEISQYLGIYVFHVGRRAPMLGEPFLDLDGDGDRRRGASI